MTPNGLKSSFIPIVFIKLLGNLIVVWPNYIQTLGRSHAWTCLEKNFLVFSKILKPVIHTNCFYRFKLDRSHLKFDKSKVFRLSMGLGVQSKSFFSEDVSRAHRIVKDLITKDEIVIFSKTYCPYCKMAKDVFNALDRKYTVIELDQREDGSAIQAVLGQMTGIKTVPRVFINGICIGGGNEIKALYESGNIMNYFK